MHPSSPRTELDLMTEQELARHLKICRRQLYAWRMTGLIPYFKLGNPLVKGETPKDGTPEFTSAIMGFVFTHCAPWPEVVRASFNDQGFRESALIFCGGLTPADFQTAFKRLEEQSRELEAAQVETMGDIGGKKPLPATNQAS